MGKLRVKHLMHRVTAFVLAIAMAGSLLLGTTIEAEAATDYTACNNPSRLVGHNSDGENLYSFTGVTKFAKTTVFSGNNQGKSAECFGRL